MTALPLSRPQSPDRHAEQAIRDFQGETAEITERPDPLSARLTVWLLAAMVVLFIALAGLMKLDRVVTAAGRIEANTPTLVVQPLETSIIRSINVREGQTVRRGDVLVTLDPTFSTADMAQLDRKAANLEAEIARLEAEAEGRDFTVPKNASADLQIQESIWSYRTAEHQAKLANFDQRVANAEGAIQSATEDVQHYRSRLKILSDIEQMRQTLERKEVGSRLNSLVASDTRLEVKRNLTASESTIRSAKHELEALRAERDVYIQQRRSQILKDLADRRVELAGVNEERTKAQKRFDLVELRAIEDAVVLEIAPISVGSVVKSADKILTLVPFGAELEIEAELPASDQGHVKLGDPVQIKFAAYTYTKHGMAKGVVRTISEDSFTRREDQTAASQPFFRARIELTEVKLRDVPPDFRLIPGMPVTADIVVGSRTILSYLVEGALKTSMEGMREP